MVNYKCYKGNGSNQTYCKLQHTLFHDMSHLNISLVSIELTTILH